MLQNHIINNNITKKLLTPDKFNLSATKAVIRELRNWVDKKNDFIFYLRISRYS